MAAVKPTHVSQVVEHFVGLLQISSQDRNFQRTVELFFDAPVPRIFSKDGRCNGAGPSEASQAAEGGAKTRCSSVSGLERGETVARCS